MNYIPTPSGKLVDYRGRKVTIASRSDIGRKLPDVAQWVPLNLKALAVGIKATMQWIDYYKNDMKGQEPIVYRREMQTREKSKRWSRGLKLGMLEYCQRANLEMIAFLDQAMQHKHGMVLQSYQQAEWGREYAQGLTLQGATTITTGTALHGCYKLDFESCHPTIALQLSRQWSDCPALEFLELAVENKTGTRKLIKHQSGQSLAASKAALIMPLYGATKTMWHKGAYVEALTRKGYTRVQRSKFFKGYERNIETFFPHLLDKCLRDIKGRAINCFGNPAPVGSDMKSEAAHLMQGYEKQCMAAAARETSSAVVWQHDAIICTLRENVCSRPSPMRLGLT